MPATVKTVAVVSQSLVSAYGDGVACCADGLLAGVSRLTRAGDSFSPPLREMPVGRVEGIEGAEGRLGRLLDRLFAHPPKLPRDARVYVATTVGEIDFLETDVRAGKKGDRPENTICSLAGRVAERLGLPASAGLLFSAACASSTAAVAMAASAIQRGEAECICVVGCDTLSEFTLSGFATLMALDPAGARPFDVSRKGVSLGEAATYTVLMSEERALQDGCAILGYVLGWGLTCDANHLTGPSRDGLPLAEAVEQALHMAAVSTDELVAVCAHGTGTSYNDQMELLAFQHVISSSKIPLFSVKGGTGHTLGAAGLVEMLLSLEFLKRAQIPGTVGLSAIPLEAEGWVSQASQPLTRQGVMVTTNSGFGGVNVALLVGLKPSNKTRPVEQAKRAPQIVEHDYRIPTSELTDKPLFVTPKHFARFSPDAQRASLAVASLLSKEGLLLDEDRLLRWDRQERPQACVGLVVWLPEGSAKMNRTYFEDYVATGSILGRGQLFAATLPTAVASEVAIALRFTGPLLYVAESEGTVRPALKVARDVLQDGLAEAMVVLAIHENEVHVVFMKEGGL
jgi:3-oxoacyl-[acyl-carrier-protein] synthase II